MKEALHLAMRLSSKVGIVALVILVIVMSFPLQLLTVDNSENSIHVLHKYLPLKDFVFFLPCN